MIHKTDKEKLDYMSAAIKTHLEKQEATSFFAVLLAYSSVSKGPNGVHLQDTAKVIAEAFGQNVDINSGFKILEDNWKRK